MVSQSLLAAAPLSLAPVSLFASCPSYSVWALESLACLSPPLVSRSMSTSWSCRYLSSTATQLAQKHSMQHERLTGLRVQATRLLQTLSTHQAQPPVLDWLRQRVDVALQLKLGSLVTLRFARLGRQTFGCTNCTDVALSEARVVCTTHLVAKTNDHITKTADKNHAMRTLGRSPPSAFVDGADVVIPTNVPCRASNSF